MLTATLLSSPNIDSDFELRPQVKSNGRHRVTSLYTSLVLILRAAILAGVLAANCKVSRACTKPSTNALRSAGGADETTLPKILWVNTLCQLSASCCCVLPSCKISDHLEPGNRLHLPFKVFSCPLHLHLPCSLPISSLSASSSSSSLFTDS